MYPVRRYFKHLSRFCVVNEVFNKEEIDKIIDLEDLQQFIEGAISSGPNGEPRIEKKYRDSDIMWIQIDEHSRWLYEKFSNLISHVNYDHFMYNIDHFNTFQYTVYKEGNYYDWHSDTEAEYNDKLRKISASVLLTDPEEYEGGEFECVYNGMINQPAIVKPKAGDVIFFDSMMPHRVAPVTKGVRKSLVTWVMGDRE